MKMNRLFIIFATIAIIGFGCMQATHQNDKVTGDPLSQWNDGKIKESIVSFVQKATNETDPAFIPVPERVAVFDMDGTILLEKPNPANFDVVIRLLVEQIAANPELTQRQPYKAIHEQDWAYFDTLSIYGENGLYSILLDATDGLTEDQYRDAILKYFSTVTDKRFDKPYNQLVFVPVVQLIHFLKDHQFEVYIVSGSDPEFTRVFCEEAIGVPVQNVLGTTILSKWVETDSGSYFVRVNKIVQPICDESGKPVNILNKIGRVPVLAVGNSSGDLPMLEYSKNAPFNLQMIVNHDDSAREYYYDTEHMRNLCQANGWQEISMKNDFKVVFKD